MSCRPSPSPDLTSTRPSHGQGRGQFLSCCALVPVPFRCIFIHVKHLCSSPILRHLHGSGASMVAVGNQPVRALNRQETKCHIFPAPRAYRPYQGAICTRDRTTVQYTAHHVVVQVQVHPTPREGKAGKVM